jgi:hypothetical protein
VTRTRTAGAVLGIAAFAATAALAVTRPPAGAPGPEGVPVPAGAPLAPPRPLRRGEQVDGITCQAAEQVAFHIHAHLRIVVRGRSFRVPAGVGAGPPYAIARTPTGPFVAAAACFMWLHTHAADGIIHIESPVARTYTLGEFFDVWGQPLDRHRLGPYRGAVTAFVDGHVFAASPRDIPLRAHAEIQLELGRPLVAPEAIAFPNGL